MQDRYEGNSYDDAYQQANDDATAMMPMNKPMMMYHHLNLFRWAVSSEVYMIFEISGAREQSHRAQGSHRGANGSAKS